MTDTIHQRTANRLVHGLWAETALLTLIASLLLLLMTRPAFRTFFLGEDFIYLGQYRTHGNHFWRAVLSPTDNIFFRPVFCAINLLWQFILPLEPWAHHVRNFGVTIISLLLLHRVLVHLVNARAARVVALFFFAFSKVHLTAIGYINVNDSIVSLMLLLATLLCFTRYIESRRTLDYGLSLLFCFLSIFTKDYGLVIVGVIAALIAFCGMKPAEWRAQSGSWALRLAPLLIMVVFYLALRYAAVGPLPSQSKVYSPQLSLGITAQKVLVFTTAMGNLAVSTSVNSGTSGAPGLGGWLASTFPQLRAGARWGDVPLYLVFMALLLGTLFVGRRSGWPLLFALIWVGAYFGPTLLTRNLQMYYLYEPLAGMAVLLGMSLNKVGRRVFVVWSFAIVIIGINGTISNYDSLYHWQFAAQKAGAVQPVIEALRGGPSEQSVTFITDSQPFWQWALTADYKGPMLPELMKLPELKIRFVERKDLSVIVGYQNELNPVFDIDNGFVAYNPIQSQGSLVLRAISPPWARVGTGVNVQPDGQSAMGLEAEYATPGTIVIMDEKRLITAYGNPSYLTAVVPAEFLTKPGRHSVYLDNNGNKSNQLEFIVGTDAPTQPRAPVPATPTTDLGIGSLVLSQIDPPGTRVKEGFNIQSGGISALSVTCQNAMPGTLVIFDGKTLQTTYGNSRWLTAVVPAELYSVPGRHQVYLKNDVSESNKVEFVVNP